MVKWGTEEIPRPPMGQKPGGKWKHWGLPHFKTQKTDLHWNFFFGRLRAFLSGFLFLVNLTKNWSRDEI